MVISAVARAATKILAKQKYAKTASVWRKENPDKIKAQKKRYYEVHKEQLLKEQKQYRKDNPVIKPKLTDAEKKIKNEAYAKSREGKVDKRFKGSGGKWADRVSVRSTYVKPKVLVPRKKRSDAGVKRGSYRLQEFTSKPTSSKYPSEQEQWRIIMSGRDVVGSSLFPSFLKGFGKTKPKVNPKAYPVSRYTLDYRKKSAVKEFEFSVFTDYSRYKAGIRKATKGKEHLSLKARAKIAKDAKPAKKARPSFALVRSSVKGKKRKMTLREMRKFNWNRMWLEAHPTHKKLLSLGGIFGGLAAYTNWNRGKKQ